MVVKQVLEHVTAFPRNSSSQDNNVGQCNPLPPRCNSATASHQTDVCRKANMFIKNAQLSGELSCLKEQKREPHYMWLLLVWIPLGHEDYADPVGFFL